MSGRRPRRRFTLADIMILVASSSGLFGVVHAAARSIRIEPFPGILFEPIIQAEIVAVALFLSLGGFGACVARWRGRARFEGFCWGFIGGPFGVLMIGLMPAPPED
jgi:hypothetical protein